MHGLSLSLSPALSSFIGSPVSKLKSKPGRGPRPLSRLYCATTLRFHACDPRFHLPSPPFFPSRYFYALARNISSRVFTPSQENGVLFLFFFFFVTVSPRIESSYGRKRNFKEDRRVQPRSQRIPEEREKERRKKLAILYLPNALFLLKISS